jgi:hypothetical protein
VSAAPPRTHATKTPFVNVIPVVRGFCLLGRARSRALLFGSTRSIGETNFDGRANLSALLSSLHGRRGLVDKDSFTFLRAPVAVVINATRAADRLFRMGSDQRRQVAVWNEAVRTGFREGPRVGLPHHCCHSCFRRGSSGSTAPVARDARGGPVRRGGGVDC